MQWTKPAYTEIRYGFEITMYILNRKVLLRLPGDAERTG